ncbi:MAG TPA: glycosyltransferase family 39 protein [Verrucomicrobiae bacterium]|nr:glycosyltransferase family 39 protein [Verrucomicrobiae bacterium]
MEESSDSRFGCVQRLIRLVKARPQLTLVLLTLAALGPFIAKPFNIDDPLFLWAAKHIQANPANPYGFNVNWYGTPMPMWEVTKNPPLACYYLAASASILGWSEMALHFAFLLPALLIVLGTYRLARQFCDQPLFAAVTTLFTPVFLVSSTSIMCDVLMLTFFVWAVLFWVEGIAKRDHWRLIASAFLVTFAVYTKYFGACLIPLLAVYGLMKERRVGFWLISLLIPIAGLVAYQWITFRLYGKGLLTDAGDYATDTKFLRISELPASTMTALAFTGGCSAVATLLTPWLWRRRTAGLITLGMLILTLAGFAGSFWKRYYFLNSVSHGWLELEVVFWSIGGVSVLGLALVDLWHRRDAESCLLALWVLGTFEFAGFLNWTVNGRSILPMAPAVAILLARRLSPILHADQKKFAPIAICSIAAAALALLVTLADYDFAQTCRRSARETYDKYGHGTAGLWFTGHWGWQYYMEQLGVKTANMTHPPPSNGLFLALPTHNVNLMPLNEKIVHKHDVFAVNDGRLVSTMSGDIGAGFYSSIWGPVPFAFGNVPPETVRIYVIDVPQAPATHQP